MNPFSMFLAELACLNSVGLFVCLLFKLLAAVKNWCTQIYIYIYFLNFIHMDSLYQNQSSRRLSDFSQCFMLLSCSTYIY